MATEIDQDGNPLTLPFDPEQVACVRMRQADIARLFEVTPAAVSQWVKKGKITAYADGTIDPAKAARELAKNCDINRLRAKPFRPLRAEVEELRQRLRDIQEDRDLAVKQKIELEEQVLRALAMAGELSAWLERFADAVAAIPFSDRATDDEDRWLAVVEATFDAAGGFALAMGRAASIAVGIDRLADQEELSAADTVTPGSPPAGDRGQGCGTE